MTISGEMAISDLNLYFNHFKLVFREFSFVEDLVIESLLEKGYNYLRISEIEKPNEVDADLGTGVDDDYYQNPNYDPFGGLE